jgi:hypothetical protein
MGNVCDSCPGDALNDQDGDGICAGTGFDVPKTGDHDNCPTAANTSQADTDHDGPGDACDVCQSDALNDGDGDGTAPARASAPPRSAIRTTAHPLERQPGELGRRSPGQCLRQLRDERRPGGRRRDTLGDACDPCASDPLNGGDGYCAGAGFLPPKAGDNDNCPVSSNPAQTNSDGDARGDVCDNCPLATNPDQANSDADTFGDACDNCRFVTNQDQADADGDGVGNVCDFDTDNDGVDDALDCAPANGTVYAAPVEVRGVSLRYAPTTEISGPAGPGSGPGTTYDIATGLCRDARTPAR